MNIYTDLYKEFENIHTALHQAELLETGASQSAPFLDVINRCPYYVTVHDVEFYRPLCVNESLRHFYGFQQQVLKGMDHFYYLQTIHTSTYHALIESISFFRKDKSGYLNLKYKILDAADEWKNMVGVSKTIIRNANNRPKVAITIMKHSVEDINDSIYEDFKSLTEREQEIVSLLVSGLSKKEIAATLNISHGTVVTHVKNIYKKLRIKKLTELTQVAELFSIT